MYNIQSTLDSVAYELRIAPWKIENSTIDNQGKNSKKKNIFFSDKLFDLFNDCCYF